MTRNVIHDLMFDYLEGIAKYGMIELICHLVNGVKYMTLEYIKFKLYDV